MNVLKYGGNYFLNINKGIYMDPIYWSPKLKVEKTFLKNKTEYMIYHSILTKNNSVSPVYLTPVKIEWVLQLNPIYYYYLFFGSNNPLYKMKESESIHDTIKLIQSNEHLFDYNALVTYLDRIGNPTISKIIRDDIHKNR